MILVFFSYGIKYIILIFYYNTYYNYVIAIILHM